MAEGSAGTGKRVTLGLAVQVGHPGLCQVVVNCRVACGIPDHVARCHEGVAQAGRRGSGDRADISAR